MPHITVKLVNAKTQETIVDQGVSVSVQQDKWGEGFKEIFSAKPNPTTGTVDWEAASLTRYRISADGAFWGKNELLIDTGWNITQPYNETLELQPQVIPLPSWNPFTSLTRDVGLGQQIPFVLMLIAIAAILGFLVYGGSQVLRIIPSRKTAPATTTEKKGE